MMRQIKIQQSITGRETESLARYLNEVARIEANHDNEEELARRIHQGGHEAELARNTLVRANLRFVVSVAKQYQRLGLELQDLINEGNIGLLKAAERYDETRGFKFISYAVWWVRQSILQAIAENGRTIRLPLNQFGACSLVERETKVFIQLEGRQPSVQELSAMTGLTEEQIRMTVSSSKRVSRLDAPLGEEGDGQLIDIVSGTLPSTDSLVENDGLADILSSLLQNCLSQRDVEILCRSFGIGCPQAELEEIASELGLTPERVRQIREKSLVKIRQRKDVGYLKQYIA